MALASGDWESTARCKLERAAIYADDLPAAFCDSARARVDIMKVARERAGRHYRRPAFDDTLYVGDGSWDVTATRELGWRLLGIGWGERAVHLRKLGARYVVRDYLAPDELLAALEGCTTPA